MVGCGLGDDAEELARRGYDAAAFDVIEKAIAWCRRRFPDSAVDYRVADVFALPEEWQRAFDLVVEIQTIESLPIADRTRVIDEAPRRGLIRNVCGVLRAHPSQPGRLTPVAWGLTSRAASRRRVRTRRQRVRL